MNVDLWHGGPRGHARVIWATARDMKVMVLRRRDGRNRYMLTCGTGASEVAPEDTGGSSWGPQGTCKWWFYVGETEETDVSLLFSSRYDKLRKRENMLNHMSFTIESCRSGHSV